DTHLRYCYCFPVAADERTRPQLGETHRNTRD
nr:hypothetical protein [Tanacetum cinerariifolium]